jgi:hypothetical protein
MGDRAVKDSGVHAEGRGQPGRFLSLPEYLYLIKLLQLFSMLHFYWLQY